MFQAWVRYGHSCYRVSSREQTYEDATMEYYCQGPLLTVENRCLHWEGKNNPSGLIWLDSLLLTCVSAPPPGRFEQAFINSLLSESGANSSTHYWMGLMEAEDSKEYRWLTSISNMPLTFANWNRHQPGAFAALPPADETGARLHSPTSYLFIPACSQLRGLRRHVRWSSSGSVGGETLRLL